MAKKILGVNALYELQNFSGTSSSDERNSMNFIPRSYSDFLLIKQSLP